MRDQMLQKDAGARLEVLESKVASGARHIEELRKEAEASKAAEAQGRQGKTSASACKACGT